MRVNVVMNERDWLRVDVVKNTRDLLCVHVVGNTKGCVVRLDSHACVNNYYEVTWPCLCSI